MTNDIHLIGRNRTGSVFIEYTNGSRTYVLPGGDSHTGTSFTWEKLTEDYLQEDWRLLDTPGPTPTPEPTVVDFEGYTLSVPPTANRVAAHTLGKYVEGRGGLTAADDKDEAYSKIAEYAKSKDGMREYIAPLLAIAHYFEQEENK